MTIEERMLARAAALRAEAEQVEAAANRQIHEFRIAASARIEALRTAAAELEALLMPAEGGEGEGDDGAHRG